MCVGGHVCWGNAPETVSVTMLFHLGIFEYVHETLCTKKLFFNSTFLEFHMS